MSERQGGQSAESDAPDPRCTCMFPSPTEPACAHGPSCPVSQERGADWALRDRLNDAIADTLGNYSDIGIGPERTVFRLDLLEAIIRVIPPESSAR